MREVSLRDGVARVSVRPDMGAGLAAYEWANVPILRQSPPQPTNPFELALNLLIPWSGRISGGGFTTDGCFHALAANVVGEALPLHGNAFDEAWLVESHTATSAVLSLRSDGPGPYRYEARVRYTLSDGALAVALEVRNRAARALPYGVGLHPWFPRTAATSLRATTQVAWREDARHLPAGSGPTASHPEWDFSRGASLPKTWINAWFTGWDGRAEIVWPEFGAAVGISASALLSSCVVYSPGLEAGFFCFEPVSHPVDAHNLPGLPGLVMLPPAGSIAGSVLFQPRKLSPSAGPR